MRAYSRVSAVVVAAGATVAATSAAFGVAAVKVNGHWDLYGESSNKGPYHGTVDVTESQPGKVQLDFHIKYDKSGDRLDLTGSGTRQGHKVDYELPLESGISQQLDRMGLAPESAGSITGTMWLTTSQKLMWTHWTNSKDGSTGDERLRRAADPTSVPDAGTTAPATTATASHGTGATTPPTTPPKKVPQKDLITLVDGDGKDVPAARKDTDGVVVSLDIDDSSTQHHLLAAKLTPPAGTAADATIKLTPTGNLKLWQDAAKTKALPASVPATASTFYIEGLGGGSVEGIGAQLVSAGKATAQDHAKVTVAHSAFLILGHGNAGSWALGQYTSGKKIDGRDSPAIVPGKDAGGKPVFWACFVVQTEASAKVALSTQGSVVAYDGHSNFGLGFAFSPGYSKLSQFMLISEPQIPVNWVYLREEQGHPQLMFDQGEYGDDAATPAFSDPVEVPIEYQGAHGNYSSHEFPASGGEDRGGTRHPLVRGAQRFKDYHYALGGDLANTRIVIKSGQKDMPTKRWSKLYLNSCYSGSYYHHSFGGHGTLYFTTEESSSPQTSALFLEGCIEGKADDATLAGMNAAENINDYYVYGN